jgi:hypothetical protein
MSSSAIRRPPSSASDGIAAALAAFDEDSQKGTRIERKANKMRLDAVQEASYRRLLALVPELADPDLILPDTTTAS